MYTYDEWGNYVLHIMTGRKGMETLKEAGFVNTMTPEEYKKHMESHYRLQKEREEKFLEQWKNIFGMQKGKE